MCGFEFYFLYDVKCLYLLGCRFVLDGFWLYFGYICGCGGVFDCSGYGVEVVVEEVGIGVESYGCVFVVEYLLDGFYVCIG